MFRAGDQSLNRNPDFLYSLFVPARAHLAFPCFDQPDLKARYTLELAVPADWEAVANGAELSRDTSGDRTRIRYGETQPIPTYLFAFAAGQFQIETAERNGRTYRMFHRETDAKKVGRNRETVFDLHASALDWLEQYTGIPYPFGKFDFVLVPSFQFGGMEHPGAIFYNAAAVLLDESATENQMLGRASLIAHETSHMWFGDLVTMRWFNDVWMKEVFANFMAAKIVNPSFPKINHELRFLVANYPAAYSVDRTAGTHPIRQELDNLNEAGSLYGAIIYQKAPIVMRQLERLLGADQLQDGLRAYLKQFAFGNASWLDLVRVLDERTDRDLAAWSRVWVEEAGRPSIRTELDVDENGCRPPAGVHPERCCQGPVAGVDPADRRVAGAADRRALRAARNQPRANRGARCGRDIGPSLRAADRRRPRLRRRDARRSEPCVSAPARRRARGSGRARRGVGDVVGGNARRARPAAGVRRRRRCAPCRASRSSRTSSSCSVIWIGRSGRSCRPTRAERSRPGSNACCARASRVRSRRA